MSPFAIEQTLLAHGHALRALARELVGDGDADDLVQETALQALRSGQQPRSPIAWLRNLMRFLASKHHRREQRRRLRETRSAAPATGGPADSAAELADSMRSLTGELLALPAPYREALLQRYLQDLSPTEIAERTDASLATVKSRLARGLALLRERFDKRRGRDWRAALATTFALPSGITIMGTGWKSACAAAAAALAVAAWWWATAPNESVPPALPGSEPNAGVATAGLAADSASSTADAAGAADTVGERQPLSVGQTIVAGRCVDEHARPLANCSVTLTARLRKSRQTGFGRELANWLAERQLPEWQAPSVTTDASGRFAFAFDWSPRYFELQLRRDDLTQPLAVPGLRAGERRDLGDLTVVPSCKVGVVVVDAAGEPVPRPWVHHKDLSKPDRFPVLLTGDDTGHLSIAMLPGSYEFKVHGRTLGSQQPIEIPSGTSHVAIRLEVASTPAARQITGEVLDERERPVAGATVLAWNPGESELSACGLSDAAGRFEVHCLSSENPLAAQLVWFKDGHVTQEPRNGVKWGTGGLRLSLPQGRGGEVHVRSKETGEPVERFAVYLHPAEDNGLAWSGSSLGNGTPDTHENGVARISGFAPGSYWLVVAPVRSDLAPAYEKVTVDEAGPIRIDVGLVAGGSREVRVQYANGEAVAGSRVEAIDPRGQPFGLDSGVQTLWYCEGTGPVRLDDARTDDRGIARVRGRRDTDLLLRVTGKHPSVVVQPFTVRGNDPVVVHIIRPGSVRGRIGPPEFVAMLRRDSGLPAAGPAPERATSAMPGLRLLPADGVDGDLRSRRGTVSVAADGSFSIEGVQPGSYWLGLERWQFGRQEGIVRRAEPIAKVTVAAGQDSRVDVDLTSWLPATVRGQLLRNGEPMADQRATLYSYGLDACGKPRRTWTRIETDGQGWFEVQTRAGDLEARVTVNRGDNSWASFLGNRRMPVQAGQRAQAVFSIESAALRLRLLGMDGKPVAGVRLLLRRAGNADDPQRVRTRASNAEGIIECAAALVPMAVTVMPKRYASTASRRELLRSSGRDALERVRIELAQIAPQAGMTIERDLALPVDYYR